MAPISLPPGIYSARTIVFPVRNDEVMLALGIKKEKPGFGLYNGYGGGVEASDSSAVLLLPAN